MRDARNDVDKDAFTAESIIKGKTPILQVSSPPEPRSQPGLGQPALDQPGLAAAIETQILAYYYSALTNLMCQALAVCDVPTNSDAMVKAIIEASYRDFQTLDNSLAALPLNQILDQPNAQLYLQVHEDWRPNIRDWRMISPGRSVPG
jgi:hypothetical protein